MKYVQCLVEGWRTTAGRLYEVSEEYNGGKEINIYDDDCDSSEYYKSDFGPIKELKVGDKVSFRDYGFSFLTEGAYYTVKRIDSTHFMVEVDDGDEISFELNEVRDIIEKPQTDTPKKKESGKNKNNAEANKGEIEMAKKTNGLMDKFGTFGKIDGVALTMAGAIAVIGLDGNYYSYENDTLVSHDDMVIDGIPGFAMPALRSTLKAGDIILDNDKGFLFVDKQKNLVSYDGTVHKIAKQSHAMFGTAMDFVSKVMDMSVMMNGQQQGLNPMMMMFMMKDEDNKGDSKMKDMMKVMMMGQMMNGGQQTDNPMANPMMMMAMMDDKDSEAMKMMFMMQFMQNQNKEAK